jgi:peptidyl-prolyl cis-trans isomerase D
LVKEKQDQQAHKDANAFLSALKSGESFYPESKKYKLEPKITGFFNRNDSIPGIGSQPEIIAAAFKLSDQRKMPEEVIKDGQGYYVVQFRKRKDPDPLGFGSEEKRIKQSLLEQKKARVYQAFLEQIRSKSEITIKEGFLE